MSKIVLLAGLFLLCSCSSFSMSKFILTEPHTELGHPLFHILQLVGPGLLMVVGTHQLSQDCPQLTLLCRTSSFFFFNHFRCKNVPFVQWKESCNVRKKLL